MVLAKAENPAQPTVVEFVSLLTLPKLAVTQHLCKCSFFGKPCFAKSKVILLVFEAGKCRAADGGRRYEKLLISVTHFKQFEYSTSSQGLV